ncbi:MAG: GNAT family N-acetyltransferase [Treponema sp.]|nr:GNAT family N-acetyltransferase [Treponema sp.]
MDEIIYEKAKLQDRDDCMDFTNFVFSHAHVPHDFVKLLPKLYRAEYFMDGIHYIAREGDRIKALVGSYPLKYQFAGGTELPGMGIGAVSVHPRSRSKGYMKTLMDTAVEDMKKNGMTFSCLGGQRQRYEYFGYTPAGSGYYFTVREPNIRHTLGGDWKTDLVLKSVKASDSAILDKIQSLHTAKKARLYRSRDRLFDILSSWNAEIFAVMAGASPAGYLVCRPGTYDVVEINLDDFSRVNEVLGLLLRRRREYGGQEIVTVFAGPHETEKAAAISRFAESWRQNSAYQFNILDFKHFTEPFLELRAGQRRIPDGSFSFKIEGGGTFAIICKNGKPAIDSTSAVPELTMDNLEATRFLFDPMTAALNPKIRETPFLQNLLPLPLFFENPDGI